MNKLPKASKSENKFIAWSDLYCFTVIIGLAFMLVGLYNLSPLVENSDVNLVQAMITFGTIFLLFEYGLRLAEKDEPLFTRVTVFMVRRPKP